MGKPGGPSASLPGAESSSTSSSGDLGDQAYRFVDFLAEAGCSVWQVLLPVPTHEDEGGSPYKALSAMAGNPELISREQQAALGLKRRSALDEQRQAAFAAWCVDQSGWLEPYVEFTALRDLHNHAPWQT